MPNIASAKKRLRQDVVRKEHNKSIKSAVRGQIRKVREFVAANAVEDSEAQFRLVTKKLDQAAAKGIFHKNKVSRLKSRLSHAIKKMKTEAK